MYTLFGQFCPVNRIIAISNKHVELEIQIENSVYVKSEKHEHEYTDDYFIRARLATLNIPFSRLTDGAIDYFLSILNGTNDKSDVIFINDITMSVYVIPAL